ncbi:MAG: hypothetical protein ABL999_02345 [Pyrinomonadaceae bacterium]
MKKLFVAKVLTGSIVLSAFLSPVSAQKVTPPATQKAAKPIVFAVLNNGQTLEPIAYINKAKFEEPVNGSDAEDLLLPFHRSYYRKGTAYKLIFGGAAAGTATVKSADPKSECGKNTAIAITKTTKTPLKGMVMALATNEVVKATTSYRRKPTAAEKDDADALARAEFAKQKLTPKTLKYHNLTALDVEGDGKAELVGSYYVEIDKLTRGVLFFIASKGTNGKYSVGYQEYRSIDQANVMSGEIKAVDEGIYNELLLDVFDADGDGTSEVFTYVQSFEGAGFKIYRRNGSKWTNVFDGSNYHCGY